MVGRASGKVIYARIGQVIDVDSLICNRLTVVIPIQAGDEWRQVNDASIDEYKEHHLQNGYPEHVKTQMALFSGFVAKHLLAAGGRTILDVGCGVGEELPLYIRDIASGIEYVGLDPIQINFNRHYPFVCGRLEDLASCRLSRPADIVIFSTSLDHFEDAESALHIAKELSGTGKVLLWIGLHDSSFVSSSVGARLMTDLCRYRSPLTRVLGMLRFSLVKAPKLFASLYKREAKLAQGERLDKLHFHYFLYEPFLRMLHRIGTLDECVLVPGTNCLFVALSARSQAVSSS